MDNKNSKKEFEIISGNVEDLDISPACSYVSASKPKININSDRKIIIPNEKK